MNLAQLFEVGRLLVPLLPEQQVVYECRFHGLELLGDMAGKVYLDYVYGGEDGNRVDVSMVHAHIEKPGQLLSALRNALAVSNQDFKFGDHMFYGTCRQSNTLYLELWHRKRPRLHAVQTVRGIGLIPATLLADALKAYLDETTTKKA